MGYQEERIMLKRHSFLHGFTLIELMIGISILAILLAIGTPSLSLWIQNSRIRGAAESIQNGLLDARIEAVRRNTSIKFVLVSLVDGETKASWTVSCVTPETDSDEDEGGDSDDLADCPGAGVIPATIRQYDANEDASTVVVNTDGGSTITFNGTGRATSGMLIHVTNPSAGTCAGGDDNGPARCLRIVVTTAGEVRMCDPSITKVSDPRKC